MSAYKKLFSEAAHQELTKIETEKAKEIVKLLDRKEYLFEAEKEDEKDKTEVAPEEHSQFPALVKKLQIMIGDLIGRKLAKQDTPVADLTSSYLDDFRDQFAVFDRDEDLTDAGSKLEKIVKKTIEEVRNAFELKDPSKKEEPKNTAEAPKPDPKKGSKKK